jgi:hypothetical protein
MDGNDSFGNTRNLLREPKATAAAEGRKSLTVTFDKGFQGHAKPNHLPRPAQ